MKQTAVEWLENEFQEICKDFGGLHSDFIVKLEQAKAMEKEQIMDAHLDGQTTWDVTSKTAEKYYNETFKSE